MILKALFNKIVRYIEANPAEHGSKFLSECAKALHMTLDEYVLQLPLEYIIQVRDYVPNAFPRRMRKGPLQIKQNNLGAWCIETMSTELVGTAPRGIILDELVEVSQTSKPIS